ncbi:CocE/NonD family hydrolase [Candidatus Poribacteria bacterium]|nr:CocE/NonD family hydrolase [Candidatus Poribacteria bacterium]
MKIIKQACVSLCILFLLLIIYGCSNKRSSEVMGDVMSISLFEIYKTQRKPVYKDVTSQSLYLTMRDGVKIAIDVILPKGIPDHEKLPALMIMARYWRSFQLRLPERRGKAPMGPRAPIVDFLTSYGYAVVIVDARGSGASSGIWQYLWSQDEIKDYGEVTQWVTKQSWSNGIIGALGVSYEGTTAKFLTVSHPTTKAVIPQEMEFDVYSDIVFPGGIFNDSFVKGWENTNLYLDSNRVPKEWGWSAQIFVKGVRPVDADRKKIQLKQALGEHKNNPDVYEIAKEITYRDDPYGDLDVTFDDMSIFSYKESIEESGAAISGWGSWMDGSTSDTAIRRFINFNNPQYAVIGSWIHTGDKNGSPYAKPKSPSIPDLKSQWHVILGFLDHRLINIKHEDLPEKILFYYTMGEKRWKSTEVWPPVGTTKQRWYMTENGALSHEAPTAETGTDDYTVDFDVTTGTENRWHTQDGVTPVIYRDRSKIDKCLLTYTSPALNEDMEITGYPVVNLYVTSTATDGAFYVYLEDVDEKGKVTYITEGQLRAIHRRISDENPPYKMLVPYHSFKQKDSMPLIPGEISELTFGLLPTSVLIKKGHRIRIAIAGHDKDTFERIPAEGIPRITISRNKIHASYIELPVIER